MKSAERRDLARPSFFLLLIPLLGALGACSDIPIGSDTTGGASTSSSGGIAVQVCQPGTSVPCYSGPMGTEGVGACASGTQTCTSDGAAYGPCTGEVMPGTETCDAAMADEDCDGDANEEGPDCVCGDGYFSPGIGEACDDGNLEPTDACDASCKLWACGDGAWQPWEACDDGNTKDGDACPSTCVFPVKRVTGGDGHTCAILGDDRIKCWGANDAGQLGVGDTSNRGDNNDEMGKKLPSVDLGAGKVAVTIEAGSSHNCALLQLGDVKCWGGNEYGQLGLGDVSKRGDEPKEMGDTLPTVDLGAGKAAVALAAGSYHTCALLNDGSVKCWGRNESCQLGTGLGNAFDNNPLPPQGDDPGEMGDNLKAVNLGEGMSAVAVAAGDDHTCALMQDGSVKCWGANKYGQLGLGNGVPHCAGATPVPSVDLGSGITATAIAAGHRRTCAILKDGSVKCWGLNDYGMLGLGVTPSWGDEPNEMGDNLPPIDLGTEKKAIAINLSHLMAPLSNGQICAILSDKSVKCWGTNNEGELGLGYTDFKAALMGDDLPAVPLGTGRAAIAIAMGGRHSCAVFFDHSLKCWGGNGTGALGLEDDFNRGDDPGEMGDALPFVEP